jgi:hypothetical protein
MNDATYGKSLDERKSTLIEGGESNGGASVKF